MKITKPTILILTTHTGGGHVNQAQALKEMLATQCEARYEVVIDDPQSELVDRWYTLVSRHAVKFLSWLYALTDNARAALWLQQALTLFGAQAIACNSKACPAAAYHYEPCHDCLCGGARY